MGEAKPTQPTRQCMSLALLAVQNNPPFPGSDGGTEHLRNLAELCDEVGTGAFRLFQGLRPPPAIDFAVEDRRAGRITPEEFSVRFRRNSIRPADERMLGDRYRCLDDRIHAYSLLVEAVAAQADAILQHRQSDWDREPVRLQYRHAVRKISLSPREIGTAVLFVEEARAESGLGLVDEAASTSCTAALFALQMRNRADQIWSWLAGSEFLAPGRWQKIRELLDRSERRVGERIRAHLRLEYAHARDAPPNRITSAAFRGRWDPGELGHGPVGQNP